MGTLGYGNKHLPSPALMSFNKIINVTIKLAIPNKNYYSTQTYMLSVITCHEGLFMNINQNNFSLILDLIDKILQFL